MNEEKKALITELRKLICDLEISWDFKTPEDKEQMLARRDELISQTAILTDDEAAQEYVQHGSDLDFFAEHCSDPEKKFLNADAAKQLFLRSRILGDRFDGLIGNEINTLCSVAKSFPQHAEALINRSHILTDSAKFNEFVNSIFALAVVLETYPHHKEQLLTQSKIFTDDIGLKKFIRSMGDLDIAVELFPEHAEPLIQKTRILTDDIEFKEFANNTGFSGGLAGLLKKFPHHTDALIDKTLQNDCMILIHRPHISDLLKILALVPQHASKILDKVIASDNDTFKKCIQQNRELIEIFNQFPRHIEKMVDKILRDPMLFDALVSGEVEWRRFKDYCSATYITSHEKAAGLRDVIALAQQNVPLAQARDEIKKIMAAKTKTAVNEKLSVLTKRGFFQGNEPLNQGKDPTQRRTSKLPPEMLGEIADFAVKSKPKKP